MKTSREIKNVAEKALEGKWSIAVLGGLIAIILGASDNTSLSYNFSIDFDFFEPFDLSTGIVIAYTAVLFAVSLIYSMVRCIFGVGYAKFNLDLVDGKIPSVNTIFSYFPHFKKIVGTMLLQTLYIFLWTLLLIIPGIIKALSYSLTSYILAENPNLSPKEAIKLSEEMMEGNKLRLFKLDMSFIGWILLSVLTCGIGILFINPYMNACCAVFYRELSDAKETDEETAYYDI